MSTFLCVNRAKCPCFYVLTELSVHAFKTHQCLMSLQTVGHAQESGLSVKDMGGSKSELWLSAGGQALSP